MNNNNNNDNNESANSGVNNNGAKCWLLWLALLFYCGTSDVLKLSFVKDYWKKEYWKKDYIIY